MTSTEFEWTKLGYLIDGTNFDSLYVHKNDFDDFTSMNWVNNQIISISTTILPDNLKHST